MASKKDFVTRNELNFKVWMSFFGCAFLLFGMLWLHTYGWGPVTHEGIDEKLENLSSVLADEYNFSEEECVSGGYEGCVDDCRAHRGLTKECPDLCREPRVVDDFPCLLYCHRTQIQEGEECTEGEYQSNVSISWAINSTYDISNDIFEEANITPEAFNYQLKNVSLANIGNCSIAMRKPDLSGYGFSCVVNTSVSFTYRNETVCRPVYRNMMTFCATPEQIEKVKGAQA